MTSPAPNPNQRATLIGSLQVIIAATCWGTLGIFSTQLGALGFDSVQISTLRIVTAGMLALVLLPKLLAAFAALTLRAWGGLALQSLIGVLGMSLCYFFAVAQVGVGMAVALLYTAPVFSLVLAKLILNEPITPKSALLAIVAVAGVACLMAGDGFTVNLGVVVGLLSGLCYALYGILGKKAMRLNHATHMVFFSSLAFSSVVLLFLPQTYATYGALFSLPSYALLLALGLSFVGTIAPFFLYMSALQKLPATRASVFTIIEPLTAIILASVLLSQQLQSVQMVGVALIVIATLANTLGKR